MRFVLALLALTVPLSAHEFHSVDIANVRLGSDGHYLQIFLQDTVKGELVICAAYDKDEKVVATRRVYTNNLATKIMIPISGLDPRTFRCVYDR